MDEMILRHGGDPNSVEELIDRVVEDVERIVAGIANTFGLGVFGLPCKKREKRLRQTKLECAELRRSSAAEKDLHTKVELKYVGLRIDISNAQKVKVELRDKVKVFQKVFEKELKRAEELTTTLSTRDQLHGAELALKVKELQDCKAARICVDKSLAGVAYAVYAVVAPVGGSQLRG
ncbi:hypothetical protein AXG93_810s1060 [Marchantia polymorpha subsp. ruderalis]|uniref:Uncharacterized protein n=1 Tax=Marchantia polymorpha subsp. ruderalis TaxID=1480154 RepID=A0A176WC01_MARPO|nr:hypothetical protein AXG93_810s1060 [Marchantia polymorpha subsp. ruderalis]